MKRPKILFTSAIMLIAISFKGLSQQVDVFRVGSGGDFLRPKGVSSSKAREIYLDSAWGRTSIFLENSETPENIIARYDLRSNLIELKMGNSIKVLDTKIVKSYTTLDKQGNSHEFVNGKNFVVDGVPLIAMIEILCKGKMSLYKRYNYYIKMPDYNQALAAGNPDEQVFLESELYYSLDNKTLLKLPSKKKKMLDVFGEKSEQIDKYIQQNKLSTSKEVNLATIFSYFNSL